MKLPVTRVAIYRTAHWLTVLSHAEKEKERVVIGLL